MNKSLNYLPIFADLNTLHYFGILVISIQLDDLSVHPVFTEEVSYTQVDVFSYPARHLACEHSVVETFNFRLLETSIDQEIFR